MNNRLDERQLYMRGTTFRNGFVILVIYLLFEAFLQSNEVNLVQGMWGNILIVVIVSAYCAIDMLLREVVDLENRFNQIPYGFLGVVGLVIFVLGLVGLVTGQDNFIANNSLSEQGARFLISVAWTLVGATWLFKMRKIRDSQEK